MSSKVIAFGTNRKHVRDFLLVLHSNPGPVLPRLRDIAGFLLKKLQKLTPTPYCIHFFFWGGVFPLDQIADVEIIQIRNLQLISREIIFEVFQPM